MAYAYPPPTNLVQCMIGSRHYFVDGLATLIQIVVTKIGISCSVFVFSFSVHNDIAKPFVSYCPWFVVKSWSGTLATFRCTVGRKARDFPCTL